MVEEVVCNLEYIEVKKKCMNKLHIHTDNGQKYLHASNFPYVFHIQLQFFGSLSWSQFTPDFDNFYIN